MKRLEKEFIVVVSIAIKPLNESFREIYNIRGRAGPVVDFLIFADVDINVDIYFQFLWMQMWMLKIMQISPDSDGDIWPTSTRGGPFVDFLIFANEDIYLQYLQMQMLI